MNYITLITKAGNFESHGHWDPTQIYTNTTYRQEVGTKPATLKTYPPGYFLWAGDWVQTIHMHIARLQPKPQIVVMNAGLWPHDLADKNFTMLYQMRQALDQYGMIGVYKTTHKKLGDESTQLEEYEVVACRVMHYCLDLSWTGNINDPVEYQDKAHFRPNVNRNMTVQLMELLQRIASDQKQKG